MIVADVLQARPVASPVTSPLVKRAGWLAPAAAGVFLGAGLFDLIPSAFATIGNPTFGWAAAGLAAMTLAATLAANANRRWVGWAAGIGIWAHSILEGIAAGTGYGVSSFAGVLISIGLVVHLIPESLALFGLLSNSGLPVRKALVACAVPWALVIGGFFAAELILADIPSAPVGRTLAFSAGAFIALAGLSWGQRSGPQARNLLAATLGIAWVAVHHLA